MDLMEFASFTWLILKETRGNTMESCQFVDVCDVGLDAEGPGIVMYQWVLAHGHGLQENIETRRSLAERLQQNKTAGGVSSFFLSEVRDE